MSAVHSHGEVSHTILESRSEKGNVLLQAGGAAPARTSMRGSDHDKGEDARSQIRALAANASMC